MPGRCLVCSLTRFLGLFQAEARLAAKRAARAEAREIRMKELERQQKEVTDPGLLIGSFLGVSLGCVEAGDLLEMTHLSSSLLVGMCVAVVPG